MFVALTLTETPLTLNTDPRIITKVMLLRAEIYYYKRNLIEVGIRVACMCAWICFITRLHIFLYNKLNRIRMHVRVHVGVVTCTLCVLPY